MYTLEEARRRLGSITTAEELRELIANLDVTTSTGVTVLYSGSSGVIPGDIPESIRAGEMAMAISGNGYPVGLIDNTDAGRFLDLWSEPGIKNQELEDTLNRIFNYNSDAINKFLDGETIDGRRVNSGIWDEVSARFAAQASGEVMTFTAGASTKRVFFQTELPIILGNPKIISIDGIPRAAFDGMTVEEAFRIITAASEERTSRLRIAVDEHGIPVKENGHYVVDARSFFEDSRSLTVRLLPPTHQCGPWRTSFLQRGLLPIARR